jgi:hypothetical protein
MKTTSMHPARASFMTLALLVGFGGDQNPVSPGGGSPQGNQPFVCDTPPEGVMSSLPPGVFTEPSSIRRTARSSSSPVICGAPATS